LHDDVIHYSNDPASKTTAAKPDVEGDHGRIETRTATVSTDIKWLQDDHQWPGLIAIGKVHRKRQTTTKTSTETVYYLPSSALLLERCNEVVHWRGEIVSFQAAQRFVISMRQRIDLADLYADALEQVESGTYDGVAPFAWPANCPSTLDQVLDDERPDLAGC
jgi:hypothetical protein